MSIMDVRKCQADETLAQNNIKANLFFFKWLFILAEYLIARLFVFPAVRLQLFLNRIVYFLSF